MRFFVTPLLEIGCEIAGPPNGSPLILVHGWPDSVRTWDRVLPSLHARGFRTFVPHLRGFGPTRFRDAATFRSGQLAALAADLIDLADALGLERFAIVGHDWGARAAYIASCLESNRVTRCVALSVGWGTNDLEQTLPLRQVQNYWYHWYMSLERGAELVRDDRRACTRYIRPCRLARRRTLSAAASRGLRLRGADRVSRTNVTRKISLQSRRLVRGYGSKLTLPKTLVTTIAVVPGGTRSRP